MPMAIWWVILVCLMQPSKQCEAVDTCLGRVYEAVMAKQGHMIITADHGNVEQMQDYDSGQVHTQHTTELVPFIYVGPTQASHCGRWCVGRCCTNFIEFDAAIASAWQICKVVT